jgi:hypothetical protein
MPVTLLQAQSFPGDRTEIVVADNGSSLEGRVPLGLT